MYSYFMGLNEMDHAPLAESLEPTDFDAQTIRIWRIIDDPSVFVRESIIDKSDGKTIDEIEKSMRKAQKSFADLQEKYGIKVVSMDVKREKNVEGNEAVFTVVDAIDGNDVSKLKKLPQEAREELEELYLSLAQYYYDASR